MTSVLTTQSPLSAGESILIGLLVTVALWLPFLPTVAAGNLVGMSHEGRRAILHFFIGITITELLMGRSKSRTSIGSEAVRVSLAVILGYLGPSLFGLAAARLISLHFPLVMLLLAVVALGLVMYLIGMSFGWLALPVVGGLSWLILRYHHNRAEILVEYAVAWLLLSLGVRLALGHAIRITAWGTPGLFHRFHWVLVSVVWLGAALAALIVGGNLLVFG